MRSFLRILLLPMLFALSLLAPAAQAQTLQMHEIHDVRPGMTLAEAISAIEAAGYSYDTSPEGEIVYAEQHAEKIEGNPVAFRYVTAYNHPDELAISLYALRRPDAAEDEWQVVFVTRVQSFLEAGLKPLHSDLMAQMRETIGVDAPSCILHEDGEVQSAFLFDDMDGFFTDAATPCDTVRQDVARGAYATTLVTIARPVPDDTDRLDGFTITMMDGEMISLARSIKFGTYGKDAPLLGKL